MVKYHEASSKANPYFKDSTSSGQCYGPSSKTDTNVNTRRNLLSYIHHAVHTPLTMFNITGYIRLTYTTLAILLEIVIALLIAVAITSATTRKTNHIPHRKKTKNGIWRL